MDSALIAAAIGVGGTVIVGLAGFWANVRNTAVARQGQVTDRYTRAVEQLGSKEMDVRVGGIYALERIARDSVRDHPTVMEVLAAFVRDHSHEQWPLPTVYEPGAELPKRKTRPDVQAAVTVIGRRDIGQDFQDRLLKLNLAGAILPGADLPGADLGHAELSGADLSGANLIPTLLTDSSGAWTHTIANLTLANLNGTNLNGANLTGADLTGADLTGADLTGALWSVKAAIPEGWKQETSGRLRRVAPPAETERNQAE